jgi:hypothetical protein
MSAANRLSQSPHMNLIQTKVTFGQHGFIGKGPFGTAQDERLRHHAEQRNHMRSQRQHSQEAHLQTAVEAQASVEAQGEEVSEWRLLTHLVKPITAAKHYQSAVVGCCEFCHKLQLPFASAEKHMALMRWTDGEPTVRENIQHLLTLAATAVGMDPARMGSHSPRIGGTTARYRTNHDLEYVKRFGRWKSDCFHRHLWEAHEPQRKSRPSWRGIAASSLLLCEAGTTLHISISEDAAGASQVLTMPQGTIGGGRVGSMP